MTANPLTYIEAKRLQAAIAQGKMEQEIHDWKKQDRQTIGHEIERLLGLWETLSEEARETVLEDVAHKLDAPVIRHGAFEVALRERLDLISYQGRPPAVPGLTEAVAVLLSIWIARGEKTGGNLHRDRANGKKDHPMLRFIAEHALSLLPAIGDGAADPEQRLRNATRRVESQLKALRDKPSAYPD